MDESAGSIRSELLKSYRQAHRLMGKLAILAIQTQGKFNRAFPDDIPIAPDDIAWAYRIVDRKRKRSK